jgi:Flp pilus assembly protein TadG
MFRWRKAHFLHSIAARTPGPRPQRRRGAIRIGDFHGDSKGTSAVEFALIAPVLIMMGLGLLIFGIALNNKSIVIHAAAAGIQQFSVSRGAATPYTTTVTAIKSAATGLTTASLGITITANGAACASDSACTTALQGAGGQSATVLVTYPCNLQVMGVNYGASTCQLSSSATGMIQ